MNSPLFWIGIRESEIADCDRLFTGSITMFGSGENGNCSFDYKMRYRFDYNQDNEQWIAFVREQIHDICQEYPEAQFMLYYPDEHASYGEELPEHLICQNDNDLIELLEDKHRTRKWLSSCVPVCPYVICSGKETDYEALCKNFPGYTSFVAQEAYSCGGSGTYFVASSKEFMKYISLDSAYSFSPYIENSISPNIHIIVYEDEILLLPPSVQLFSSGVERFHYQGADYVMFSRLPVHIVQTVYQYARLIGDRLRFAGYRGVCGIDFLSDGKEVYFMEVNARFQSSSFLINKSLSDRSIACSIQELHRDAFLHRACSYHPLDFSVEYSFWGYSYEPYFREQLRYIHALHTSCENEDAICMDDGLDWNVCLEKGTYLFKSIFHGNIAALSPEFTCRIHSNIDVLDWREPAPCWDDNDAIRWKIMLLNHGVRISEQALKRAAKRGGINYEEFAAIDMHINRKIYVNVPYMANRSQISPFEITLSSQQRFILCYQGKFLADIDLRYRDELSLKTTKSGIPYSDIGYLSNDRLRIFHRFGCFFKEHHCGCKFCDVETADESLLFEEIKEVLDAYKDNPNIRHYLVGGGSDVPSSDFANIIRIVKYMKVLSDKPIYLMSLPPQDIHILKFLKQAGITEVAFNLEIFDRDLAQSYMPGKGKIPLEVYRRAFKESVALWGNTGNVRTIFVVGLEPKESLLKGIEYVSKLGVSPILSLFKPIAGTDLSHLLAPCDEEIYEIYCRALCICKKNNVELGPSCHCCEDNTLKVSLLD
ncbi:MAG: ATP-grasp domain-containing protein [Clostridium sp.]|nr:ATP-grasp domain-containing protein [Clostridium sp.]